MCVRDHSYACVYVQGLGTPAASHQNIFDSGGKTDKFSCAPDGVQTSGHGIRWILRPTLKHTYIHTYLIFVYSLTVAHVRYVIDCCKPVWILCTLPPLVHDNEEKKMMVILASV